MFPSGYDYQMTITTKVFSYSQARSSQLLPHVNKYFAFQLNREKF